MFCAAIQNVQEQQQQQLQPGSQPMQEDQLQQQSKHVQQQGDQQQPQQQQQQQELQRQDTPSKRRGRPPGAKNKSTLAKAGTAGPLLSFVLQVQTGEVRRRGGAGSNIELKPGQGRRSWTSGPAFVSQNDWCAVMVAGCGQQASRAGIR